MQPPPNILSINEQRNASMFSPYDPIRGIGSPLDRVKLLVSDGEHMLLPKSMLEEPLVEYCFATGSVEAAAKSLKADYDEFYNSFIALRLKHDFEFWAALCWHIQDKEAKQAIKFMLRKPQRKLLARLEKMRLANVPIRVILLKARQWGGSTLVQVYMFWIQKMHRENWHSVIVADVEEQARNIRGMISRGAKLYPIENIYLDPHEGSSKNRVLRGNGSVISIGSMQKPENLRSFDFAMTHLSEVGVWKATEGKKPEDLVQSIRAAIANVPYSIAVLESTAKGVGNFFHREWLEAVAGRSAYDPVFVAWWEIELYWKPISDYAKFIKTMPDYGWVLWNLGASLESINWYFSFKAAENYSDWRMKSEFPSWPEEAFQSTGFRAFEPEYVMKCRKNTRKPSFVGEIFADTLKGKKALSNIRFENLGVGNAKVWEKPDTEAMCTHRYAMFVDIGGRHSKADKSEIVVLDRFPITQGWSPEVVFSWTGNIDQDVVAWKAAQIGMLYHKALIAVEINSLKKTQKDGGGDTDHFLTILDEIKDHYPNLYTRTSPEKVREGVPVQYGFHTNRSTKPMIIDALNAALRDETYIERESEACDQMDMYEVKEDGSYGAVEGQKDDKVINRAGVVWLSSNMPQPELLEIINKPKKRRPASAGIV